MKICLVATFPPSGRQLNEYAFHIARQLQCNPDVELTCKETANAGDWFLGSTWEPNVVLPVNAISQGESGAKTVSISQRLAPAGGNGANR